MQAVRRRSRHRPAEGTIAAIRSRDQSPFSSDDLSMYFAGRRRNPDLLPRAPGPSQRGGYTAVDERSIPRRAGDATASWDENDTGGDAGAWRPRGRRRSIESDGIGRI